MTETMKLLEKALTTRSAAEWTRELHLSYNAISAAKARKHLSPAVAGAMAEMLGLDATKWIAVAALESDKDSACKSRMMRKFGQIASL